MKNINISNFSNEVTLTDATAAGIFLYISYRLAYQERNDWNLYEKTYLEPTFIEITNLTKRSVIVDCIYKHSTRDLNEFNCYCLNALFEKLAKEQKHVLLFVDFNADLLKYEQYKAINEFLGSLSHNMFLPGIIQRTRIPSFWNFIIENIFFATISLMK